ncbi:ankyrin [Sulfurovum lithotrophicum]|uniref:Ankyrin n=1 Tax=Sulfurovum lithotrophicum TaxID=206403 RepID=A0A7U4LZE7_9BACT|nr:ankyrin repeat domain-containing protein [Sulfurovum lithotrophicum]AKF24016.1 ankyrin [Sulfurovum lithotrophicum]
MNKVTQAIENDSIATLKSLLEEGVDLNKPILIGEEYDLEEYDEISPLFYAIRKYASLELIEFLLENGVDIHSTDSDGISALDMAIKFKRKDLVKFCMDQGIDINTTARRSGILPLQLAACFNDTEMIQMLLDEGADINATDASGMSAKDYARKLGQKGVVEYLTKRGGRHNLYPEEG